MFYLRILLLVVRLINCWILTLTHYCIASYFLEIMYRCLLTKPWAAKWATLHVDISISFALPFMKLVQLYISLYRSFAYSLSICSLTSTRCLCTAFSSLFYTYTHVIKHNALWVVKAIVVSTRVKEKTGTYDGTPYLTFVFLYTYVYAKLKK